MEQGPLAESDPEPDTVMMVGCVMGGSGADMARTRARRQDVDPEPDTVMMVGRVVAEPEAAADPEPDAVMT
jgi:hypothetical protein